MGKQRTQVQLLIVIGSGGIMKNSVLTSLKPQGRNVKWSFLLGNPRYSDDQIHALALTLININKNHIPLNLYEEININFLSWGKCHWCHFYANGAFPILCLALGFMGIKNHICFF